MTARRPPSVADPLAGGSQRTVRLLLVTLLTLYTASLFCHEIRFADADLGRHLKNGELFFAEDGGPTRTNHYSYTEPDHEVINHHWGTGVLFHALWSVVGFPGLVGFYAVIHAALVLGLLGAARRESGFSPAFLSALACVPLLAFRPEVRPEGLSYLLLGLYYLLLWGSLDGTVPRRALLVLPVLQVAWTNLHLFFCLGPLLAGAAVLDAWLRGNRALVRTHVAVALGVGIACLVNPFGLAGLLEPFTILEEYGYPVAENQSVFELQRSYDLPVLGHFQVLAVVLAGLSLLALRRAPERRRLGVRIALLGLFGLVAFRIGRAVGLFAVLAIPVGAAVLRAGIDAAPAVRRRALQRLVVAVALGLLLAPAVLWRSYLSPFSRALGIGLAPGVNHSAEFFLENRLEGPIFNDYDIGGYLIFHLFPEHRVFVDNRPEAYSVAFLREVYIPMQEDEKVWESMERRHGFNVIYFSRNDRTPWARSFLVRRLQDPTWAPVHADRHALILLKRNERNRELIERFEPKR